VTAQCEWGWHRAAGAAGGALLPISTLTVPRSGRTGSLTLRVGPGPQQDRGLLALLQPLKLPLSLLPGPLARDGVRVRCQAAALAAPK
jgi:hypothetical protein